jgi:hypothetical protein
MFKFAQARCTWIFGLVAFTAQMLAPSAALAADVPSPAREVTLPVELKDPFIAYTLGLVPLYATGPAYYVGISRVNGELPPNVAWASAFQDYGDLALAAGGFGLARLSVGKTPVEAEPLIFASAFCYALIPVLHFMYYGPHWARMAASFNKSSLELHGYKREAEIVPLP